MARHPDFAAVDALVLLSPNHAPRDTKSAWLTRPFGPLIARAMAGAYREWEPASEAQGRYWSTRYPTAALVQMMRLVDLANGELARATVPRALLVYSAEDQVIDVDRAVAAFTRLPAGDKTTHRITGAGGPSGHVLAGDILSPESNAEVVRLITGFLLSQPPSAPARKP
jgi:alpha-beta hydrolase superfamily lysophospholipase